MTVGIIKKLTIFTLAAIIGVLLSTAAVLILNNAVVCPRPDPYPEPYVVHERPVTTVEMVVGLSEMLVKERARADRLEAERDNIRAEAELIIRNLSFELNFLRGFQPTPAIPDGSEEDIPVDDVIIVPINPC